MAKSNYDLLKTWLSESPELEEEDLFEFIKCTIGDVTMKHYEKLAMLVQEIQGQLEDAQADTFEELIPIVAAYLEKKVERKNIDELLNKVKIPQKSKLMEIEMLINNMEKDVDAVSQVI